jgi:capsule polysaccharide modification protein KpsS
VFKLIHENFGPGDKLVSTQVDSLNQEYPVYARGFVVRHGVQKILLVDKRDRSLQVSVPGAAGGQVQFVDQTTSYQAPASAGLKDELVTLRGFAVAVVTLAK